MKSFNALAAVVLVAFGSTVWADDPAPTEDLPNVETQQLEMVDGAYLPPSPSAAYTDFPDYYPGYSSYRGLGFMGSCCEQTSCCAQHAWDGYCETKGCAPQKLFHGWADKLHCCLPKPICRPPVCSPPAKCCDTGCGQKGCPEPTCCDAKPWLGLHNKLHFGWKRPACGAKADYCDTGCGQKGCPEPTCCDVKPWHGLHNKLHFGWKQPICGAKADCCDPCGDACCVKAVGKCDTVAPTWHKTLCGKLHGRRGHWGGLWHSPPAGKYGECCEPAQGKGMWIPADMESPQYSPVPEPTASPSDELPPPEVTTDYVPEFPDFNSQDRSATRHELRRLPNTFMSL